LTAGLTAGNRQKRIIPQPLAIALAAPALHDHEHERASQRTEAVLDALRRARIMEPSAEIADQTAGMEHIRAQHEPGIAGYPYRARLDVHRAVESRLCER
jgi:hypothetical protein